MFSMRLRLSTGAVSCLSHLQSAAEPHTSDKLGYAIPDTVSMYTWNWWTGGHRRGLVCQIEDMLEYSQLSGSCCQARLTTFMLCTDLILRVLKKPREISLCKLLMTSDGRVQARLSQAHVFCAFET